MRSPDATIDRIAALLQQGLDHYGRNEIELAVKCWREVIAIDPHQPDASDYLESAGVAVTPAQSSELVGVSNAPVETLAASPELEKLLRERRYEDALKVLYAARASAPKDQAISRSIRLLRERVAVDYASRLVNLDRVPARGERISGSLLSSEERQVLSLVDGISSYGDIVAASPMGRLNTLRMLCSFLDTGLVTASSPSVSPPNARSGSHLRARAVAPPEQVPPTVPSSVSSAAVGVGIAAGSLVIDAKAPSSSTRPSSPPRAATPTAQSLRHEPPPSFAGDTARRSQPPPSAIVELPPSSRPSRPPVFSNSHPDDGFDALFAQATEAYLLRDFQRAVDLFTQCSFLRPADRRVLHNLKALQRRLSST